MREYLVVWEAIGVSGRDFITLRHNQRMTQEMIERLERQIEKDSDVEQVLITSFQLLEEPY